MRELELHTFVFGKVHRVRGVKPSEADRDVGAGQDVERRPASHCPVGFGHQSLISPSDEGSSRKMLAAKTVYRNHHPDMGEKRCEGGALVWVVFRGGDVPAKTFRLRDGVDRSPGSFGYPVRDRFCCGLDTAVDRHHSDRTAQLGKFGDLGMVE